MAENSPDLRSIFLHAVEILSPTERESYLQSVCGDDSHLRKQINELLSAHSWSDEGKTVPMEPGVTADFPMQMDGPGIVIGPYQLRHQLGEGGMGTVYVAHQSQPVRRDVALKLIKPGMDSRSIIARFEQERQALAMMDHPNIAKVFDAGTTPAGRPFFVMELIKGLSITKYCDQEHLTPRERIALFIPICHAVQHAHQKGIVHRDLKPSNILVGIYDGKPVPKVIDFGVAKATGQKLTADTLHTEHGIVGTVEYMSPEQADPNNIDIDTRADIYSLGVVLYELLTGSPPFTSKQLRGAAFDEMLRIIREVEPQRPSTKISTSDELPSIAANRKLEPKRLTRMMHGDLNWIVMKCLEKPRNRRYETMNSLALDLTRYLNDEPVEAGPPSATYRISKFARRHRTALVTTVAFLILIVGSAVLSSVLAVKASLAEQEMKLERDKARAAEQITQVALGETKTAKETTEKALSESEQARKDAQAVNKFLIDAFRSPDPSADGRQLKVVQILDQAMSELERNFAGEPKTKSFLMSTLGETYLGLGLPDKAKKALEGAKKLQESLLGKNHRETLKTTIYLGVSLEQSGQAREAEKLLRDTLALCENNLGKKSMETLLCRTGIISILHSEFRWTEALPFEEETYRTYKEVAGPEHLETLACASELAYVYQITGDLKKGIDLLTQTCATQERLFGPRHIAVLITKHNLAYAQQAAKNYDESIRLLREILKIENEVRGADHPDVMRAAHTLANSLRFANRYPEAIALFEKTLKMSEAKLGPAHGDTLGLMFNLAQTYRAAGQLEKMLPVAKRMCEVIKANFGVRHYKYGESLCSLGDAYIGLNRHEDAIRTLEEALQFPLLVEGKPDFDLLHNIHVSIAQCQLKLKRYDRAEKSFQESLTNYRKVYGNHPDVASFMANIARCQREQGKLLQTEQTYRDSLQWSQKNKAPEWRQYEIQSLLADVLVEEKKFPEAEKEYLEAQRGVARVEKTLPQTHKDLRTKIESSLSQMYAAWGKPAEAAKWHRAEKK